MKFSFFEKWNKVDANIIFVLQILDYKNNLNISLITEQKKYY